MASIDKTYIDGKEYPLDRQWWIDNYDKMVKDLGMPIYLYPFHLFYPNEPDDVTPEFLLNNTQDLDGMNGVYDYPIWNTSEHVDKWLVNNCTIQSFKERMLDVYSPKWSGFKGQNWVPKPNNKPKCKR